METTQPLVTNAWYRRLVLGVAALIVAAAALIATGVAIDMSFGPTFSTEPEHVDPTDEHLARFGAGGSTDVVALVDVGNLADRQAGLALADLAQRLQALDEVAVVTDVTDLFLYAPNGQPILRSLRDADGALVAEPIYGERVAALRQSAPLQRLLVSNDLDTVVVAATLADARDFGTRRAGVEQINAVIEQWSTDTGYGVAITGFPEIERVYAKEITFSVLLVIAVLYVIVSALLFLYLRNVRLAATAISGVTLAMPLTLAGMRLLGQPFSIVNSQVLTLVAIVGIAHGLHQVDAYRKSRVRGETHAQARAHAAETLWPSIATGLTTVAGFLALAAATMPAVRSFGFSTAVGVGIVYALNATLIPVFLEAMATREIKSRAPLAEGIARVLQVFSSTGRKRPGTVVLLFIGALAVFSLFGIPRLTVDQRVSEELPTSHPTRQAQELHEQELSGYLGPNVWIRGDSDLLQSPEALASFVNSLCSLEGVLHVASPLDLIPQRPVAGGESCSRLAGDLAPLRFAGADLPGGTVQATNGLVGQTPADGLTVRVRTSDFGTARALELIGEIDTLAAETLPDGTQVNSVGDWVLAQHGMDRLSTDVGLSAGFALLVVLPMIGLAIRNLRMFLAALLPTILPVIATLAFLGAMDITLRIGTAMILAICLGLAADDTIYIFTDVKRKIAEGAHPSDAMEHALKTSGPPALFSSVVLVAGLLSMSLNQLLVLRDMGIVAAFTMTYAVLSDLLLGPSIYHLLNRGVTVEAQPVADIDFAQVAFHAPILAGDQAPTAVAAATAVVTPAQAAMAELHETVRIPVPVRAGESTLPESATCETTILDLRPLGVFEAVRAEPELQAKPELPRPSYPIPDTVASRSSAETPNPELQVSP